MVGYKFVVRMKIKLFIVSCFFIQFAWGGVITTSITSLPTFGNVYVLNSSTSIRYTVSANALAGGLTITAPAGFEISTQYLQGYTSVITLLPNAGIIPTTNIYARFSPSITGAMSGNITHVNIGSPTQNISVQGTGIAWAIAAGYYSTVSTQRNAALKTILYNRILNHTSVSYANVWSAYSTTDRQPNGKVWDIYSTRFDTSSPYEYNMGSDQCGTYAIEGDCYNREHSFPQSWFASNTPMQTDIHHLFASDGKVNGMRNNYPFGNVSAPTFTSLYGGKLGTGANLGYTGIVFEPIDEYKGDIARAQLYMATRYENLIASWIGNGNANDVLAGNTFPAYDAWFINLLISWHNLDPVSDKERKRNDAINTIQNNRNPFIDSPQFVQRIWGGDIPTEPTVGASNFQVTNINNNSVKLNWVSGNGNRRIVLVRAGAPVNVFPADTFHYSANANLTAAPQIGLGNYIVYNGTGSTVTLTNMQAGVNYHYAVIEYNGWYSAANYNTANKLTSNGVTLPVTWLGFDGIYKNKSNHLFWSTASEKNSKAFVIERSINNKNFDAIGIVNGEGHSNVVSKYQYTDNQLPEATAWYYRLKQIDFDGKYNYSKVIKVEVAQDLVESGFEVSPNPFVNNIRITYQLNQPEFVYYELMNSEGQLIKKGYENANQNEGEFIINLDEYMVNGLYFLQIKHHNRNYIHKIIKQ